LMVVREAALNSRSLSSSRQLRPLRGELGIGLIEHPGYRTPGGPPGQAFLLGVGRGPRLGLHRPQGVDGRNVGGDPGVRPAGDAGLGGIGVPAQRRGGAGVFSASSVIAHIACCQSFSRPSIAVVFSDSSSGSVSCSISGGIE